MARLWNDELLVSALKKSKSIAQILRLLGLKPKGGNYGRIQQRLVALKLDCSHLLGQGWLKGSNHTNTNEQKKKPIENCLVENGLFDDRSRVRRHIFNTREARCAICGIDSWLDKPVPIQMDHINGINTDHRESNLRLICANCHAQTETFCGRNLRGRELTKPNRCSFCDKKISPKYKMCKSCYADNRKQVLTNTNTKVVATISADLIDLVKNIGVRAAAATIGTSHTTLRKKLLKIGIVSKKINQHK